MSNAHNADTKHCSVLWEHSAHYWTDKKRFKKDSYWHCDGRQMRGTERVPVAEPQVDWDNVNLIVENHDVKLQEMLGHAYGAEEVRVVDPNTGGEKGRKLEEYALVPVWPVAEVARVYGWATYKIEKYEPNNWRKGFAWSLSISAMMRHLEAWRAGETNNPESGLNHLAHAMFHIFALMEFERLGLGTDDRGDV